MVGPLHMWRRAWGDPTHSAPQLLNGRFAKVEMQKQEYDENWAAIRSSGPHKEL